MNEKKLNKIIYSNKRLEKRVINIEDYMNDNMSCIIPEHKQQEIMKINFDQIEKSNKMQKWNKYILTARIFFLFIVLLSVFFGIKVSIPFFDSILDIGQSILSV